VVVREGKLTVRGISLFGSGNHFGRSKVVSVAGGKKNFPPQKTRNLNVLIEKDQRGEHREDHRVKA